MPSPFFIPTQRSTPEKRRQNLFYQARQYNQKDNSTTYRCKRRGEPDNCKATAEIEGDKIVMKKEHSCNFQETDKCWEAMMGENENALRQMSKKIGELEGENKEQNRKIGELEGQNQQQNEKLQIMADALKNHGIKVDFGTTSSLAAGGVVDPINVVATGPTALMTQNPAAMVEPTLMSGSGSSADFHHSQQSREFLVPPPSKRARFDADEPIAYEESPDEARFVAADPITYELETLDEEVAEQPEMAMAAGSSSAIFQQTYWRCRNCSRYNDMSDHRCIFCATVKHQND